MHGQPNQPTLTSLSLYTPGGLKGGVPLYWQTVLEQMIRHTVLIILFLFSHFCAAGVGVGLGWGGGST